MPPTNHHQEHKWWKEAVVYQVYPASFKDSNDDGIGDIPGLISKLDYLRDLGVDVIWLSPHYKSPQVDMGYDISNFEDIHEPYGSLQDVDRLIKEVHERKMRIIFDLVINHTSDQHLWFQEARSSRTSPKRGWFIWRPARYDENGKRCRPNNWRSQFTKPAWTWDEVTQEYYLHLYAPEQPDLNWENEDCRRAIYDSAIKFWLEKGIDGFRVDTVNKYSKVPGLPDAEVVEPEEETQVAFNYYTNGPRIHEFLKEIHEILNQYDVFTVGELPNTPDKAEVMRYISADSRELNMVFNFDAVNLGQKKGNRFLHVPFDNADFKRELTKWQSVVGESDAWTTVFLENHDQGRSVTRFASDLPDFRRDAAKMLAVILGTLTGTLFLYQGQEIGMINAFEEWSADDYQCVRSVNYYQDIRHRTKDDPAALRDALENLRRVARDHARAPMQWDSSPNSGFSSSKASPWMRVLDSYREINVADQVGDSRSVLEFWRRILALRKQFVDLFVYGNFHLIEQHKDLMVFEKRDGLTGVAALTVANLSKDTMTWDIPESLTGKGMKMLIGNMQGGTGDKLRPYEAVVYMIDS